jgi:cell division transport system ATP-binding protein
MIRFENVTKSYRRGSRPGLSGVDFEIERGEFVFLVGPSGSGKSTCLRLILREGLPSTGKVFVLGRDLTSIANRKVPYFRRHVGSVFQDFRLLQNKTVFQNVAFTLQVTGASRGYVQQLVPQALELVGLAGKEKRLPHELSGGEQQRVAIARAIINRPDLLIADEPTGSLDHDHTWTVMDLFQKLNLRGMTMLVATHDRDIIRKVRKRTLHLSAGTIRVDDREGACIF